MNSRVHLPHRLARGLGGLGGLAWLSLAQAQAPAVPTPPAEPAYQDQYIRGGTLAPDISSGDGDGSEGGAGLARSLQLDGIVSVLGSKSGGISNNVVEEGIVAKSQWETARYGAFSLDAALRAGATGANYTEQGQGGVVTLRQRAMPFDGGWTADNALGDLNSPDIALARLQPRFYLPTGPMQGLSTEWRGPSGLQLVAGAGEPGLYDGIVIPNFRTLGGSTATAGAEFAPAEHWTVGGQFIEARDVNIVVGPAINGDSRLSTSTGLVTAAWQDKSARLQFNLLDGGISGTGNGLGSWVDGAYAQGRVVQNAGVFRIDPNLTWGNQLIANDTEGGYYRLNYQSRQWLADVGIDAVRSVSGEVGSTTFLTGDTRYQISRDWGVGGVANVSRTSGGTSWSAQGYLDHLNRFGSGRAQADIAETPSGRDLGLLVDQTWSSIPAGLRLSTSASLDRISGAAPYGIVADTTVLGLSAYGGGQLTARLGIEGNVRYATAISGRAAPGISANVSLSWQIAPHWQMLATYYDSEVGAWTPLVVDSPLTPPTATVIPGVTERGVFLTVRYLRATGSHFAPLGGPPGAGSGELTGIVYLDANNNGRPDAGEAGAPNVTVILDGRYSVQTDVNGRFDFPVVASGRHVVTVIGDNVPLPWTLVNEGRLEVDVSTRGKSEVSLAAQRLR